MLISQHNILFRSTLWIMNFEPFICEKLTNFVLNQLRQHKNLILHLLPKIKYTISSIYPLKFIDHYGNFGTQNNDICLYNFTKKTSKTS